MMRCGNHNASTLHSRARAERRRSSRAKLRIMRLSLPRRRRIVKRTPFAAISVERGVTASENNAGHGGAMNRRLVLDRQSAFLGFSLALATSALGLASCGDDEKPGANGSGRGGSGGTS